MITIAPDVMLRRVTDEVSLVAFPAAVLSSRRAVLPSRACRVHAEVMLN